MGAGFGAVSGSGLAAGAGGAPALDGEAVAFHAARRPPRAAGAGGSRRVAGTRGAKTTYCVEKAPRVEAAMPCQPLRPGRVARKPRIPWKRRHALSGRCFLVAAFGDAGHAFPALALARELHGRGHEVVIETWEKWRSRPRRSGSGSTAEEYGVSAPPPGEEPVQREAGDGAAAVARRAAATRSGERRPRPGALSGGGSPGAPRATPAPHLYPVYEPGMPFFGIDGAAAHGAGAKGLCAAQLPALETGLRRGRRELNETRAKLGSSRSSASTAASPPTS